MTQQDTVFIINWVTLYSSSNFTHSALKSRNAPHVLIFYLFILALATGKQQKHYEKNEKNVLKVTLSMNIMPVNNQSDRPDKHWSQFSVNAIWVEVSNWQQWKANVSVQTYLEISSLKSASLLLA